MNTNNVQLVKELLTKLNETSCTHIYLPYYMNRNVNSFDELRESIEDNNGFDVEIIHYGTSIEYLMNNDNSLRESLEIAIKYGYNLNNLNSKVLASLLATEKKREEFEELETELTDLFEQIAKQEENESN